MDFSPCAALLPLALYPKARTMLIAILSRTPVWVWALLSALLALGLWQTRPRRVRPQRLLVLPLVLLVMGLWSMTPVFARQPVVGLVWLLTLLLVLRWARHRQPPAAARWLPEAGVLVLPGSWVPMVVIVAVFSLRYSSGVMAVMHPEWRSQLSVQLPLALAFGALSGFFLGRNLALFQLTRRAAAASALPDATAAQHHAQPG